MPSVCIQNMQEFICGHWNKAQTMYKMEAKNKMYIHLKCMFGILVGLRQTEIQHDPQIFSGGKLYETKRSISLPM